MTVYPVGGTSRHRLPPPAGSESGPPWLPKRPSWAGAGRLTASRDASKTNGRVSSGIQIVVLAAHGSLARLADD